MSPVGDATTFRPVGFVAGFATLLKVGPLNGTCVEGFGFFWTPFVGLRTPCVGLEGLLGAVTTLRPFMIGALFSGGLIAPCEGLGEPCSITLLMVGGDTTLIAELKGASLAVNGIVGCRALFNVGLLPLGGLLPTGLGGLGWVLSTGSLPINLKIER